MICKEFNIDNKYKENKKKEEKKRLGVCVNGNQRLRPYLVLVRL